MIIKQIIVGNLKNFTYVLADKDTRDGVIIDPSWDVDKVIAIVRKDQLKIKYILNTHSHWDHTCGNKEASQRTGAKIVAHKSSTGNKDISVEHGDVLSVGAIKINVMHTPGHCLDSVCYFAENSLFTGDTLFVGGCGRVDLPGGNATDLYNSFFTKILKLDDSVKIYPGHDYGSRLFTSLRYEKKHNTFLEPRSETEFIKLIANTKKQ